MSGHGFKSLFMAASVAGAALGCYLVSLNVASERAKLEAVEGRIVTTQGDIRLLQTEIGTRGRLAQLERWNANFIRLSAPTADQFLEGGFQLATLVKPAPKPVIGAPVVLASAPTEQGVQREAITNDDDEAAPVGRAVVPQPSAAPDQMMHVASYERPAAQPAAPATARVATPRPAAAKSVKIAAADSLAPLPAGKPDAKAGARSGASGGGSNLLKTKESGTPR
jgi:hypothetical protein